MCGALSDRWGGTASRAFPNECAWNCWNEAGRPNAWLSVGTPRQAHACAAAYDRSGRWTEACARQTRGCPRFDDDGSYGRSRHGSGSGDPVGATRTYSSNIDTDSSDAARTYSSNVDTDAAQPTGYDSAAERRRLLAGQAGTREHVERPSVVASKNAVVADAHDAATRHAVVARRRVLSDQTREHVRGAAQQEQQAQELAKVVILSERQQEQQAPDERQRIIIGGSEQH